MEFECAPSLSILPACFSRARKLVQNADAAFFIAAAKGGDKCGFCQSGERDLKAADRAALLGRLLQKRARHTCGKNKTVIAARHTLNGQEKRKNSRLSLLTKITCICRSAINYARETSYCTVYYFCFGETPLSLTLTALYCILMPWLLGKI